MKAIEPENAPWIETVRVDLASGARFKLPGRGRAVFLNNAAVSSPMADLFTFKN